MAAAMMLEIPWMEPRSLPIFKNHACRVPVWIRLTAQGSGSLSLSWCHFPNLTWPHGAVMPHLDKCTGNHACMFASVGQIPGLWAHLRSGKHRGESSAPFFLYYNPSLTVPVCIDFNRGKYFRNPVDRSPSVLCNWVQLSILKTGTLDASRMS